MFCNHCGKEVEEDSLFCRYCGKALDAENEKETIAAGIQNKVTNKSHSPSSDCGSGSFGKKIKERVKGKEPFVALALVALLVCAVFTTLSFVSSDQSNADANKSSSYSSTSSKNSSSGSSSVNSSSSNGSLTDSEIESKAVSALYSELKDKAKTYSSLDPGSCKYSINKKERGAGYSNDIKVYGHVSYYNKNGSLTKVGGDYGDDFTVTMSSTGLSAKCVLG